MTDPKHPAAGVPAAPAQDLRSVEPATEPARVGARLVSGFSEFFSSRKQSRRGLYLGLVRVEGREP